jgi:hypothetical protein
MPEQSFVALRSGTACARPPAVRRCAHGPLARRHTASLFPGHPEIHEKTRWMVGVPQAGHEPTKSPTTPK